MRRNCDQQNKLSKLRNRRLFKSARATKFLRLRTITVSLHFARIRRMLPQLKNYAVQQTDSPWLLFLDPGVEPIETDWLTIMAEHVQRREVGAVGARLINPNGTIEHAGLVLGVNGIAQSAFHGFPAEHPGVNRQLQMTRNSSAITGACLLTRREVFQEIGGFDETLSDEFAAIDLCLKMRRAGYLIVYTPLAKLCWDASSARRHRHEQRSGYAPALV